MKGIRPFHYSRIHQDNDLFQVHRTQGYSRRFDEGAVL